MKYKFNLSLDDFSPRVDSGKNFRSIFWCNKLIDEFPDIKIDLFIPAAYARLNDRVPSYLTKNMLWVKKVKELPQKNYRIGLHGLYHRRSTVDFGFHRKGQSNNDELQFLRSDEACIIFDRMIMEFDAAGIAYGKVLRPPGWKISTDFVRLLAQKRFVIAGDEHYYDIFKTRVPESKWVVTNWHVTPDFAVTGDVVASAHTTSWVHNFFDQERYELVCGVLRKREYEFKFLEEWW